MNEANIFNKQIDSPSQNKNVRIGTHKSSNNFLGSCFYVTTVHKPETWILSSTKRVSTSLFLLESLLRIISAKGPLLSLQNGKSI